MAVSNNKYKYSGMEYTKEELDAFTLKFTKQEIIEAIKEDNLLDIAEPVNLFVIYYENKYTRKIDVLTKDRFYDMWKLLKEKYLDKAFVNKVVNFIRNKVDESMVLNIKNSETANEFLNNIGKLSYLMQRKLYLYLYE